MIEGILTALLGKYLGEAISKSWNIHIKSEDIKITDIQQKINEILVNGEIILPKEMKAKLQLSELTFYLPGPIIPLPPPLPPAPPIPLPPIVLPPISVTLKII
jgi:hypothetical protein